MQLPEQPYRWLVTLNLIRNEGELGDRGLVSVPASAVPHFESGYLISQTVRSMLKRAGAPIPACLDNVKKQGNKAVKASNWANVWLSFEELRMQFDARIRDLIVQGENTLIVEIVKQLCERDERKSDKAMAEVVIRNKLAATKSDKINNKTVTATKGGALDIKKINLQRNPDESESSLQFLILLLSSSLNMNVEQILGLFTNQNKYLAHIIVKGINQDFTGIVNFYNLLNKHSQKLRQFVQQDKKDAQSCLYAIKPGFISKNQQVTELTIEIFHKIGNIYDWLVSDTSKGATTLLLGVKRHPNLVDELWNLLDSIIRNQEMDFFARHYRQSFKDPREMVQISQSLARPLSESFLKQKLLQVGTFNQWIELASNLFSGSLDDQVLTIGFLSQMMLCIPDSIAENEQSVALLGRGWREKKMCQFVVLVDEMLSALDKLALNRSHFASRVYQLVIEIFQEVRQDKSKKQYLVESFGYMIPRYPKMPVHYFIEAYEQNYLDAADYDLIKKVIKNSEEVEGLTKIGELLLKIYNSHAVLNFFVAPLILTIAKKTIQDQIGQGFVRKAIKQCLHANATIETSKKNPQIVKPQPMYFNQKGNSQKLSEQTVDSYKTKQKQSANIVQLIDKLCDLARRIDVQALNSQVKEQLLNSSAYIRKNNFKVGSKGVSAILRKFNISKQDQQDYDDEYRNKKSIINMEESLARKKSTLNNLTVMAASRIGGGPEHLKKQFSDIVEKRKREQQQRKAEQQRKQKQQQMKLANAKKQLQRQQLLRGFGSGQAELKQQGFWNKLIKQQGKDLQLYPPLLMQQRDTDYIENIFKRYHRITRYLFIKYSSSMYSTKSINNFQDNLARKQTLNLVETIKFLKEYKLFFLTTGNQIQNLIRDINVKLLNKRQTQELDFVGFEHFLVQFAATVFTKAHTINTKTSKGIENVRKSLMHLSHAQLLEELFNYMRLVFLEKGEKTTMFDQPEAAYFNQSDVIKEFNKKIEQDPGFILPEGYKKVTEKVIIFVPLINEPIKKGLNLSYIEILEVLDEIIYESQLNFHILEPISVKETKTRVKPHAFTNIKPKLMTDSLTETKVRALSSAIDRKIPAIPPPKMLERKVLSFGMKLGLSYISYKDKLLGEQVAYIIDDMITAVENGRTTIEKEKIVNEAVKKREQMTELDKKQEEEREKKRKQRKQELQKMKKQAEQKKNKQLEQTKQEREKKKQKQLEKEKKKKQDMEKYLAQQKAKLKEKKSKEEEAKAKQQEQKLKKKQEQKKAKEKFKQFNQKQIEKLKKQFEQTAQEKKKAQQKQQEDKKVKDQMFKKLRSKISSQDKKLVQLKEKNNEQIHELFTSQEITEVLKKFEPNLKATFDFLIRSTHLSLTQRKHNNEIILQTWNYFNMAFQLNPYIINAKNVTIIFRNLTKQKQISKEYYIGLNFEEFQQALLRIAIKHKTVFNKIAEKIKETDMSDEQIDAVIDRDIEQKQKNQFDEPKEIDVKGLLVEEDINKQIFDDYGEIKKVTPNTLKGLIYYLRVPKDKAGQEKRFREILGQKNTYMQKYQKLKEKLKEQYSLASPQKKKKADIQVSKIEQEPEPDPELEEEKQKPTKKAKK